MANWSEAAEESINSVPSLTSFGTINSVILASIAYSLLDISHTLKEIKEQNER